MCVRRSLIACLTMIATGCGSLSAPRPPPPETPEVVTDKAICVSCAWLLDDTQLDQLRQKAEKGDAEAAFRVALHFSSADNRQQHRTWLHRAAELGHPVAQYNIWFNLRDSKTCSDQLAALAWLERSAAQGFREAKEQLKPFQQLAAPCQVPPNNSFKPSPLRGLGPTGTASGGPA